MPPVLIIFHPLKKQFLCHLLNQFMMTLTTIASRQVASSGQSLPLFPEVLQFTEEEHQQKGDGKKWHNSRTSMTGDGAR